MESSNLVVDGLGPLKTRFHVFLLACQHLRRNLPDLTNATENDHLDKSTTLTLFNEALHDFLHRCGDPDPILAAQDFGEKLNGKFSSEHRRSPNVVEVINRVRVAVETEVAVWDPETHLGELHSDAREVARRLFEASPYKETQLRRERRCDLVLENQPVEVGNRPAMHYILGSVDDDPLNAGTIHIPFNATKNFSSYLDYPFLFLHEYSAHVIAIDHGSQNVIFNDGWMMVVAWAFFIAESAVAESYPFNSDQVYAFDDRLRHTMKGPPSLVITETRAFQAWLRNVSENKFTEITYQLASFRPIESERPTWPRFFINRLFGAYRRDPKGLGEMIAAISDVRELLAQLPPLNQ